MSGTTPVPAPGPRKGEAVTNSPAGCLPGISVVIIGLNAARDVAECLDSVLASDYPQDLLEVVYVDGGSLDESVEIARRRAGVSVVQLAHPFPSPGRGRNAGLHTTGQPLVQFLDSDSYVHPGWFRKAVGFLRGEAAAVSGSLFERQPRRNIYHRVADFDWRVEAGWRSQVPRETLASVFGGNVLARRDAVEEAGGYDESLAVGEEADLSWRIRHRGWSIAQVDIPMATHDIRMDSFASYSGRALRSGYAYAQIAMRFRKTDDKLFLQRLGRIALSACVPVLILGAGLLLHHAGIGAALACLVALRSARKLPGFIKVYGMGPLESVLYVLHLSYVVYPQFAGVIRYFAGSALGRPLRNTPRRTPGGGREHTGEEGGGEGAPAGEGRRELRSIRDPSPQGKALRVMTLLPNFVSDRQIAYACLRIVDGMRLEGRVETRMMGLCSDSSVDPYRAKHGQRSADRGAGGDGTGMYQDAIPRGTPWSIAVRVLGAEKIQGIAERKYLRSLARGDVAYLWPDASLRLHEEARSRGCVVLSERINTLRQNSRAILEREFNALGIPPAHGITVDSAIEELRCMQACDYIFSPSPAVSDSLRSAGIAEGAILPTSYGLRPGEILGIRRAAPRRGPVTALFVGRICVRKGVHLLLKAWERAGIDGRLRLVGTIAAEMKDLVGSAIGRLATVEHVDHVDHLGPLYRDADFLVLPSVEEGSPLVTYLALGASLPVIASPMGAGGVITDGVEGIIVDPHDTDGLVSAMQSLSSDPSRRAQMSEAAGRAAATYTWDKVGARRRALLLGRLQG
jgi:glycosyltransferase involved in cell wall biosynthesis